MHIIKYLYIFFTFLMCSSAHGNKNPFKAVEVLFSAMTEVDHAKMKSVVTNDFQLLEVGEDWDMDQLIAVVKPSEYSRRNYFSIIKTKISGEFAWVSYWNKATFTKGESLETVAWLESAVLVKENNSWKIQMLHSTKLKPENLPKDIVLIEH